MKKLILILTILATLSLAACTTDTSMKMKDISSRGISITGIIPGNRSKAYRAAEKHCAKYYKVPRVLKSESQLHESEGTKVTMVFECVRQNQ